MWLRERWSWLLCAFAFHLVTQKWRAAETITSLFNYCLLQNCCHPASISPHKAWKLGSGSPHRLWPKYCSFWCCIRWGKCSQEDSWALQMWVLLADSDAMASCCFCRKYCLNSWKHLPVSPFLSCIHTLSSVTIKAIHPGLREESLVS